MQVAAGYVLHVGEAAEGTLRVGDTVSADVDIIRRARIVPNHTFTHVLNFALREVCSFYHLLLSASNVAVTASAAARCSALSPMAMIADF